MDRSSVAKPEITTVRGIACVALVAYHVVGTSAVSGMHLPDGSMWHRVLDALDFIRMPIFAVVAGYVYARRRVEASSIANFLKSKVLRLAIPLVFVTTTMVGLRRGAYGADTSLTTALTSHYQHLWFLQALLIIFVLMAACDAYARLSSKGLGVVALTTLALSSSIQFPNTFSLNGVVYLAPLFLFGMILRGERQLLDRHHARVALWFVMLGLILQQATPLLGGAGLPNTSLPAALCGCGAAYLMLAVCPRIQLFEMIGAYSYTIYLWHSVAAATAREFAKHYIVLPTPVMFAILLAIGVAVPIALHFCVRRVPVLATLVAGLRAPGAADVANTGQRPSGKIESSAPANDNGILPAPAGAHRSRRQRDS